MNLHPNFICLSCWIVSDEMCADMNNTPETRAICPRRRIARANLPAEQVGELKQLVTRYRPEYQLKRYVRMVEIQAERNAL